MRCGQSREFINYCFTAYLCKPILKFQVSLKGSVCIVTGISIHPHQKHHPKQ